MMVGYRDRDGNRVNAPEFIRLFSDPAYRVVRKTELDDGDVIVSTVWIGVKMSEDSPLFETMIFGLLAGNKDEPTWRYRTLTEARKGHTAAVEFAESYLHAHRELSFLKDMSDG